MNAERGGGAINESAARVGRELASWDGSIRCDNKPAGGRVPDPDWSNACTTRRIARIQPIFVVRPAANAAGVERVTLV